jgi:outer membrane protein TolC
MKASNARRWALLLLGGCLGAALARAETLADAWRLAHERDGALAAAESTRDAAADEARAATRARLPVLELTGGYTQMQEAPYLDIETPGGRLQSPKVFAHDRYASGGAELSLPLWTSGRLSGAIGAARASSRGAGAAARQSAADLKLAVAERYVAVLKAEAALRVAESAALSLKAHAADVEALYAREAAPKSDLLAARVALANAEEGRLRASHARRLATAAYNRAVGEPLDRAVALEALLPASDSAPTGTLAALTERALRQRPEVEALSAEGEGYRQAARAELAGALPQVVLKAGFTHLDNQILDRQDFASVGVGFQWRVFDSGQVGARVSALRGRSRASEARLRDLRSAIELEVEAALLEREDAAARREVARAAVAEAEENRRLAGELYTSGLGTETQVLEAEVRRAAALTNRDAADFDARLADIRVRRALGEL